MKCSLKLLVFISSFTEKCIQFVLYCCPCTFMVGLKKKSRSVEIASDQDGMQVLGSAHV